MNAVCDIVIGAVKIFKRPSKRINNIDVILVIGGGRCQPLLVPGIMGFLPRVHDRRFLPLPEKRALLIGVQIPRDLFHGYLHSLVIVVQTAGQQPRISRESQAAGDLRPVVPGKKILRHGNAVGIHRFPVNAAAVKVFRDRQKERDVKAKRQNKALAGDASRGHDLLLKVLLWQRVVLTVVRLCVREKANAHSLLYVRKKRFNG